MRKDKIWEVDLFGQKPYSQKNAKQLSDSEFWTSDTEAFLAFRLFNNVTPDSATLNLYNRDDKSLVVDLPMVINNQDVEFELTKEIIAHFGTWSAQAIFKMAGESYTSPSVNFSVSRELGADLPEKLGIISDWKDLDNELREFIAEVEKFTAEDFVELKMGEKLQNLEVDYATRLTTLTAQLAQTKSEVERKRKLEDLDPEVLSAIEGGEGTSFDLLSRPQEDSVNHRSTTFLKVGKNILDKDSAIRGYLIEQGTGNLIANPLFYTVENIPVQSSTPYYFTSNDSVAFTFRDKDFNLISTDKSAVKPKITPENAKYMSFSALITRIGTEQIELGSVPTDYESFGYLFKGPLKDIELNKWKSTSQAYLLPITAKDFKLTVSGNSVIFSWVGRLFARDKNFNATSTSAAIESSGDTDFHEIIIDDITITETGNSIAYVDLGEVAPYPIHQVPWNSQLPEKAVILLACYDRKNPTGLLIDLYRSLGDTGSGEPSVYQGDTLSILGDSISTHFDLQHKSHSVYYTNTTYDITSSSDIWHQKLINALDMRLLINNAYSGSTVSPNSAHPEYAMSLPSRYADLHTATENPDVIAIFAGTNDINTKSITLETFKTSYDTMLLGVQTSYPLAEIWVGTVFPQNRTDINRFLDFNNAIVEIANKRGAKIMNISKCGIHSQNETTYLGDVTHPKKAGHSLIANQAIRDIDNAVRVRF